MTEMQKSGQEKTTLELLAELGQGLFDIGKTLAVTCGLIERNPEYKRLPQNTPLYINCKPYVVKRSQEDGEKDLVKLANDVHYEGAWFYTPQDSNWYHISKAHKEQFSEEGMFRLSAVMQDIDLDVPGNKVVHYHTHPKVAPEHTLSYINDKLLPNCHGDDWDKSVVKAILSICTNFHACFPSSADIASYVDFRKQIDDGLIFEGRIASPLGITQVEIEDPSESTIALYEKIHNKLYERMRKDKIVKLEIRDTKTHIGVYGQNIFDSLNREMKGKMKLTFVPAENYFQMCGR